MYERTTATGDFASTRNSDSGKLAAVKERLADAKHKLVDVKDKVVKGGDATIEKTRSFVISRPLGALAIAFGVGYLAMRVRRLFG